MKAKLCTFLGNSKFLLRFSIVFDFVYLRFLSNYENKGQHRIIGLSVRSYYFYKSMFPDILNLIKSR